MNQFVWKVKTLALYQCTIQISYPLNISEHVLCFTPLGIMQTFFDNMIMASQNNVKYWLYKISSAQSGSTACFHILCGLAPKGSVSIRRIVCQYKTMWYFKSESVVCFQLHVLALIWHSSLNYFCAFLVLWFLPILLRGNFHQHLSNCVALWLYTRLILNWYYYHNQHYQIYLLMPQ